MHLHSFTEIESPPEMTPEIEEKLEKTAMLLLEIANLWSIPDTGIGTIDNIPDPELPFNEEHDEKDRERLTEERKTWLFNWYQTAPFVPLFFNPVYYNLLKEKMSPYYTENKVYSSK